MVEKVDVLKVYVHFSFDQVVDSEMPPADAEHDARVVFDSKAYRPRLITLPNPCANLDRRKVLRSGHKQGW